MDLTKVAAMKNPDLTPRTLIEVKTKPIVLIEDSVIKHRSKKLSQGRVHKFLYPGKTVGEIAEVLDSIAVASDPSHVIIHTGTNNLPSESAESCVTEIKNLALKMKNN